MRTRSKGVEGECGDHFEKKGGEVYRLTEKENNLSLGSNPVREQFAPTVGPKEFEGRRN